MIAENTKSPEPVRCAIYTRKSTTEGLEQEFNSLDAQRESATAFIASQRGEGWIEVQTRYDDDGFTGGNMDRPALKRLLADIKAKRVDCVVDESLLNETCNRVQRSIEDRRSDLHGERSSLVENIQRTEAATNALSKPSTDPAGESLRLDSLASLSDQLRRDQKRCLDIVNEIERIENGTPNRIAILKAITDLQTLWDHLTIGERSRLVRTLIERIDHDPAENDTCKGIASAQQSNRRICRG